MVAVDVDDPDDCDDCEESDDDELARCALFRGMNMRATSSGFIELRPPCPGLVPHAGRLIWGKLGGLATAVICEGEQEGDCT